MTIFSETLKAARRRANLTQKALAERSGLPLRSLLNWEQGRRLPRLQTARRLAKALRVPPAELLEAMMAATAEDWLRPVKPKHRGRGGK